MADKKHEKLVLDFTVATNHKVLWNVARDKAAEVGLSPVQYQRTNLNGEADGYLYKSGFSGEETNNSPTFKQVKNFEELLSNYGVEVSPDSGPITRPGEDTPCVKFILKIPSNP